MISTLARATTVTSAVFTVGMLLASDKPKPVVIEACSGGEKTIYASTHSEGDRWFSLVGHVVDDKGRPVCAARVVARYLGASDGGAVPSCVTGKNGEYVLDNLKKGEFFEVMVNPYQLLEYVALSKGRDLATIYVTSNSNVRDGGLLRYNSGPIKSDVAAGSMTLEVVLVSDSSAVGIVSGTYSFKDGSNKDVRGAILSPGGERIELRIDQRLGTFVAYGVLLGRASVSVEAAAGGGRRLVNDRVVVRSKDQPAELVQLVENAAASLDR